MQSPKCSRRMIRGTPAGAIDGTDRATTVSIDESKATRFMGAPLAETPPPATASGRNAGFAAYEGTPARAMALYSTRRGPGLDGRRCLAANLACGVARPRRTAARRGDVARRVRAADPHNRLAPGPPDG